MKLIVLNFRYLSHLIKETFSKVSFSKTYKHMIKEYSRNGETKANISHKIRKRQNITYAF